MAQDRRGVSAAHVGRELGLCYSTAWTVLHKLRRSLSGRGERLLKGVVEVDETYYGGKGSSESGGRSLNNENKMLIVMAVERKLAPPSKMPGVKGSGFVAGNAKVALIPSASSEDLSSFLKDNVSSGANIITDGWAGYNSSGESFEHEAVALGNPKNAGEFLPLVYLQFNNFKAWVKRTFHGVSKKYMPAHLDEWNYRFNRRSLISNLFQYVLRRVTSSNPIT